jgi:hypothetical protein
MFKYFPELGKLTHDFAVTFWQKELANSRLDIRNDCLVESPQNLIDDLIGKDKVIFVGKKGLDYIPTNKDIVLQYWVTDKGQTHFTLAKQGEPGVTEYDAWKPASPWRLKGRLSGYRIFRIKE